MRNIIFSILLFTLGGCQVTQKNISPMIYSEAEREPASLTCRSLFTDSPQIIPKIPSVNTLKSFFNSLKVYGTTLSSMQYRILNEYIDNDKDATYQKGEDRPLKFISTSQVLAIRGRLQESTARILKELGWRETDGYLIPPANLPRLYQAIYKRIFQATRAAKIADEDAILPALIFEKRNYQQNTRQLLFIRPGIDPLPHKQNGFSVMAYEPVLTETEFTRLIMEKKVPLSYSLFFHDMGHVVDLIERPQYGVAQRNFYSKISKAKEQSSDNKVSYSFGPISLHHESINFFLNEWLWYPKQENTEKIKKIIPDLQIKSPKSLETLKDKYRAMSLKKLTELARLFLRKRYILFANHGGSSRDWNLDRFSSPSTHVLSLQEIQKLESGIYKERSAKQDVEIQELDSNYYLAAEPPRLFQVLETLIKTLDRFPLNKFISNEFYNIAKKNNLIKEDDWSVDTEKIINLLLPYYLAEIEYRAQMALHYEMTPEQAISDMAKLLEKDGWQEYRKTKTYQYYSTYRRYSTQWLYFVDVAREFEP